MEANKTGEEPPIKKERVHRRDRNHSLRRSEGPLQRYACKDMKRSRNLLYQASKPSKKIRPAQ